MIDFRPKEQPTRNVLSILDIEDVDIIVKRIVKMLNQYHEEQ